MAKTERLDKVLSHAGWGSRKDIKRLAKEGLITVDGEVVTDPSLHVDPTKQIMAVDGELVVYKRYVYLMLNKPAGVVSATEDARERTVLDLVPPEFAHYALFPVGRLDKDTEGLLLLTNDGPLAHNLLSPKKHVDKTYFARIDGEVNEQDVAAFARGVILDDGYKTLPAKLVVLRRGPESAVEVTIREGKFHQVKRMFAAVGKKVLYLKRLSMGALQLDPALRPGEVRELTAAERALLGVEE